MAEETGLTPLTAEQEATLKEIVQMFENIVELRKELKKRKETVDSLHEEVKRRRTCRCRRCTAERLALETSHERSTESGILSLALDSVARERRCELGVRKRRKGITVVCGKTEIKNKHRVRWWTVCTPEPWLP